MKKITTSLLFLLLTSAAGVTGAYAQPKLAVLVVGMETDAAGDEFAAGLGYDLARSGAYELATKDNNPAVAAKLAALRAAHTASTPVDTAGLAAWGRANGIGFVQLVVESASVANLNDVLTLHEGEQVAQLVNCSTGELMGRKIYRMNFQNQESALIMMPVTGGVFEMGCKTGRDNKTVSCYSNETPVHWVRVNDFRISKYPITQAQWKAVMGSLPSKWGNAGTIILGDDKPVLNMDYSEIVGSGGFLETLNALTGKSYRLPTEAEWEYAARGCSAGNCESFEFSGSDVIGDVAWYYYNVPTSSPQPVGTKAANRLGIYDMTGNVYEYCGDYYSDTYYPSGTTQASPQDNPTGPSGSGSYRVLRGGNYGFGAFGCRVAYRYTVRPTMGDPADAAQHGVGFRIVLP